MTDSRVTLAAEFFQAVSRGDVSAASQFLDPGVVEVVPGRHAPAGVFQGVKAVVAHLSTFLELTDDAIDVLKWDDWMAGVDNVAGLANIHLQRDGERHEFRLVLLVSVVDRNGTLLISRIETFYDDQAAFERFFSVES